MTTAIWSSDLESHITVEFDDEQYAALTTFVKERADDGEWFTPTQVANLMPAPHNENDDFDMSDIVQAFLPNGFAVEMHGWEDFCIVPAE